MTDAAGGTDPWLLYGAYGYTGRLIVERALERGLRPVLAGRNERKTRALAETSDLDWRVFSVDDRQALRAGIEGMRLVLNAAGPFSATWRPVLEACLEVRCGYLDITGEIDVLEAMQELDGRARAAGVHVVPAVGFDVVPTDCAAAMAAALLDRPTELDLAFHVSGGPSRGTTRTTIERLGSGGAVRVDGRIESIPIGSVSRTIAFSDRARRGVAIPWGDVSTAYRSTGIPNIRVFATLPRGVPTLGRVFGAALEVPVVRSIAEWAADRLVTGPGRDELSEGFSRVRAEVRDGAGHFAAVELLTPNAYALTATASVAAAEAVLGGSVRAEPGVHTPSRAFGADFVTELPGVRKIVGRPHERGPE
ncbi:MAG: saccharopine dehydrogenase NADP-binding domain-containing protein [Gemmatimonadota bacterium]